MKKFVVLFFVLLFSIPADAQPFQEQLTWQNRTRKFITFLPQDYNAEEPMPLVINMHPFLTDGPFQMRYTKFSWLADTAGVIVVYPYGIQGRWNSGSFLGIQNSVDDIGFINALIDYMSVLYNIDTRRVYATGYSAGGYMSYTLACDLTNRIAAIASVSGTMNPDTYDICNPDRPMPVMVFNGTSDAIVAYNGSPLSAPVEDVVELWRSLNDCDAEPATTSLPNISTTDNTTTDKITYNNCADGAEVIFYKILNGGHTWPGRNFPLLGNTAQDIKANDEIWNFFKRHQIPDDIACERPSGLSADVDGNTATLQWDAVPGIDFYSLLYSLPGGELVLIEDISETSVELEVDMEGELAWMVRAQCESGHVSWSAINREDITARMSSGKLALHTYPNPVSDVLHVEFLAEHLPASISIVNAYGHELLSVPVQQAEMSIDISGIEDGVLHILVNDDSYAARTLRKW